MNKINKYSTNGINFISIEHNNFKIVLCDYAASVYEIWFDHKLMNVQVLDPESFKQKFSWFGKTIGRVAGRLPGDKLTIDGQTYHLLVNELGNTLHGGLDGLSNQIFQHIELDNNQEKTTVIYHYLSPENQSGFPGNYLLKVIYEIDANKDEFSITFKSKCDKKCPINITNHTYFSLGEKNIDNLKLFINADKYVYSDYTNLLPIDDRYVSECLDFRKSKLIMKDIANPELFKGKYKGYDHYYIFKEVNDKIPQIQLDNDMYHLDIYTDYPGLKIYSDNFHSDFVCQNTIHHHHRGLAIETQYSDRINPILEPGQEMINKTKYCFKKK